MRIAMIGQKGIPTLYGGIERHVEELSRELVNQGHDIFVYSRKWFTPKNLTEHAGIKIVHTPTIKTKHFDAIIHTFTSTFHAIFVSKPDIIHYHGVGPSLASWLPRVLAPKIKVIATFHCIDRYHQKWGLFARLMLLLGERFACLFPHKTIAVSKTIQNYCLNEFHVNTTYNPNGISIKNNPGTQYLSEWNLEPQKYLVMISRLVRHKGAHYLIDAWQRARERAPGLFVDKKLAIVGGSAFTDDYVRDLKAMAGNDKSIVFTDWQKDEKLHSLFANALMMVHPSENEGLPITVLEAMSFGLPVLVSDIPEHQEVINDGRFWAANTSVDSLVEKIITLVSSEVLLKETGQKNLAFVKKDFQWKDIAERTANIYRETLMAEKQLQTA